MSILIMSCLPLSLNTSLAESKRYFIQKNTNENKNIEKRNRGNIMFRLNTWFRLDNLRAPKSVHHFVINSFFILNYPIAIEKNFLEMNNFIKFKRSYITDSLFQQGNCVFCQLIDNITGIFFFRGFLAKKLIWIYILI